MAPRVSSYYSPEVYTISPSDTLAAARNMMLRYKIRRLVVVDEEEKPVGILTATDIAEALLGKFQARPLDNIRVEEIMNKDVITIEYSKSIKTAARLMIRHRIGGLPVVSPDGRLMGIITKTDLVKAFADRFQGKYRVADLKRPAYAKASPTHSVYYLWRLIHIDPSGKIIVIDSNERPIGVITKWDLATVTLPETAMFASGKNRYMKRKTADIYGNKIIAVRTYFVPVAENIMTPNPITTTDETDAADAAKIMVKNKIGALPVIDENEVLTGVVTKREFLLTIAQKG